MKPSKKEQNEMNPTEKKTRTSRNTTDQNAHPTNETETDLDLVEHENKQTGTQDQN